MSLVKHTTLRRKVLVSQDAYPNLVERLNGARIVVENAKNLTIEYHISDDKVGEPERYFDYIKKTYRINSLWFQGAISNKAIAEGYDGAVYIFTLADSEKWGGLGSGLRASTIKDGDIFDEMWIRSDDETMDEDGYRIERSLAHEEGHCVKHRGITTLEVHDFDRNTPGDLESFFERVDATGYTANRRKMEMFAIIDMASRVINLIKRKITMQQGMVHPIPKEYREHVSQAFLVPNNRYQSGVHNGTDWAVPIGTPLRAPMDGLVDRVYKNHPEMGNACDFKFIDPSGVQRAIRLLHLKKAPLIGQYDRGETIAKSGDTGNVTGPHCHIDLWLKGLVDVLKILTRKGVQEELGDPYEYFINAN